MAKTYTFTIPANDVHRINAEWKNLFVNSCVETVSGNRATIVGDDHAEEFDLTKGTRHGVDERLPFVEFCNKNGVSVDVTLTLSLGKYSNSLFEESTTVAIDDSDPVDVEFTSPQPVEDQPADGITPNADGNLGAAATSADIVPPANAIGLIASLITSGTTHGDVRIGKNGSIGAAQGLPLPSDGSPIHLPLNATVRLYNGHGSAIDYSLTWLTRS